MPPKKTTTLGAAL
jgi:16S rRNA C967 or C1407 C5-methylase (RsmB/RsmF family)